MLDWFNDRLNSVIAYKFLHNFATGLVSVFIPIYFAQKGLPIHEVFGIVLTQAIVFGIVALPVGIAVSRFGINRSFLFSSIIYVLLFISVQFFAVSTALGIFAGLLNGLGMAFHWIPLNSEFTEETDEESRSEDYGKLEGIPSLISPLAPLIGAFIMSMIGFYALILVSFIVIGISAIPLLSGKDFERPQIDLKNSMETEDKDLWLLYFLDGFASVPYVFVFPLFVFFVVGGTLNTGIVKTLAGMGSGLLALGFGYLTGKVGKKKILFSGILISGILCLYIPIVGNSSQAFLLSFLLGIGYIAYTIPLVSMISDVGDGRELLGFFSVREVFQNLGRALIILFLVVALYLIPESLAFRLTFYLNATALIALGILTTRIGKRRDVTF